MSLVFYDILFLVVFFIGTSLFLYFKRKNLAQEGSLILYKTQWGVKFIDKIGQKYKKIIYFLSYVSVFVGYLLMAGIIYLIIRSVYIYLTTPISEQIRAPPVMPLIPYFPQLFGLGDVFPAFYFVYFIFAILIVATMHELSHGIFARASGIRIKSTGFAFFKYFPALFGAFVEQDEKQMNSKSKFQQMSVLSAGVFANVLVAVFCFIIMGIYFSTMFTASGVGFYDYAFAIVPASQIVSVNGISLETPSVSQVLDLVNTGNFSDIQTANETFVGVRNILDEDELLLYYDAPAIRSNLGGIILEVNNQKITNLNGLSEEIKRYNPGEKIKIKTMDNETELVLGVKPNSEEEPWLGIVSTKPQNFFVEEGIHILSSFQSKNLYLRGNVWHSPRYPGISEFFYYLFWWIFLINILVALFNMLPVGILDGGRFFYLTILGISQSKKFATRVFRGMNYFIFGLFLVLILKWAFSFF